MNLARTAIAAAAAFAFAGSAMAAGDSPAAMGGSGMPMGSHDTAVGTTRGGAQAGYNAGTVRNVQEALQAKGIDAGPVDGIWGPKTQAGIREFQQQQGMDATGSLNSRTLDALDVMASEGTSAGSGFGSRRSTGESSFGTTRDGMRERTPEDMGAPNSAGTPGSLGTPGTAVPR